MTRSFCNSCGLLRRHGLPVHCMLLGGLLWGFPMSLLSAAVLPQQEGKANASVASQSDRAAEDDQGTTTIEGKSTDEAPEFVRVSKESNKLQALQTAIATYRKPGEADGIEVALIGAVHVADASYYSRLNQIFRDFDALLYEMVIDPAMGIPDPEERGLSPVSTIQVGLKDALEMTFQLDEVDYRAENFVHADMTPEEFFESMNTRKDGLLQIMLRSMGAGLAMQGSEAASDLDLIAAMISSNRTQKLRQTFARQMQMMDGQMAALTGEDGKSTLITERNVKAFEVLQREIEAGKRKLGIFYGAGHLDDMHQRLVDQMGFELVETEWLDAWDLK